MNSFEKLKSVEPSIQLVLRDISNLRMHWDKLKKKYSEEFDYRPLRVCDDWYDFHGENISFDKILEDMEESLKDVLGGDVE